MKINLSKERCMRLAELEGDHTVASGPVSPEPVASQDKPRLVHVVKVEPTKWSLGKALCNRMISRWSETSGDPGKVTCKTCLKRMPNESSQH